MALQFIQYLDRRSFGSRFARLDRETASILLLNATLHDQGRYPTASDRFASTSTSSAWTTSAPEIQSAVGSHVSDTERGKFRHPTIGSPSTAADKNAEITAPFILRPSFLLMLTGIQRLPRTKR
jgi:hypothetical protein